MDGFAELWFESAEAMQKAMNSPAGQALPRDEKDFLGRVTTFATRANDPQGPEMGHYVICSPSGEIDRDLANLQQAISLLLGDVNAEYNVVEGLIRRPPPPSPQQEVGIFAGLQFASHSDPQEVLSRDRSAPFLKFLKRNFDVVSVVDVDQFRVV